MTPDDIRAATELTEAVNGLKSGAMIFILIMAGLALGAFYLWLRARKQERASKEERAERFNDTLLGLKDATLHQTVVLDRHTNGEQVALSELNGNVTSLGTSVGELHGSINELVARQSGFINRTDSIRLIQTYFEDVVVREIQVLFEVSIKKNDYEERRAFVETRVKTEMANIVGRAAHALSEYKLGVNHEFFFERVPEEQKVRYTVVDALWKKVKPIYLTSGDCHEKIEEMRVLVENTVKDYVARIRSDFDEALYEGGERASRASIMPR